MAIPWLAVLSNIPWRDVIVNAPKVADEAKKLWTTLNKDKVEAESSSAKSTAPTKVFQNEHQAIAALQKEVSHLQDCIDDLHQQMLDSSKVIKSLADQNEQLVKHIEVNRSRLKLVTAILIVFIFFILFTLFKWQPSLFL